MKPYAYVISDIHGQVDLLDASLIDYDPVGHRLVLTSNLSDRGSDSKACFLKGKELVEQHGAVHLRDNYEEHFLQSLQSSEDWPAGHVRNGGKETIESLSHPGAAAEYSPAEMALIIRGRHPELIGFLTKRPLYFEWQHYLSVHARVDLTIKDWRQTAPRDFLRVREPFHQGKNNIGKTITFSHTITPMLHSDMQTTDLRQSDGKIEINGSTIFGSSVHGVIFNEKDTAQDIRYQKRTPAWQPEF